MKLIIKQYLSSLKERNELDALLPDLLAMMGLNVFSKPSIGTRQYGVDVAAFGKIDGEAEKVYLFSIKGGDLDRQDWNSGNIQDLKPSLDEIREAYIPTHLPSEHKDKSIEICICFGGDLKEAVRLNVAQYENKYKTEQLTFSEWDGDRLTQLIEKYFLNESLLPKKFQSMLRKSLALIDEPNISYKHFSQLVHALSNAKTNKDRIKSLRQLRISLGILIAWCKEENNLESAYLSAELTVLHSWEMVKPFLGKKTKSAMSIVDAVDSIVSVYLLLSIEFINKIAPHIDKKYAISSAVGATNKVDVNLKLFDLLGRIAINGIWNYQLLTQKENDELIQLLKGNIRKQQDFIIQLIDNNPILLTPYKDEQAIDIAIAVYFLMIDSSNRENIYQFLKQINEMVILNFKIGGRYPSNLNQYNDLIEHPIETTEDYKKSITKGSILYPYIAFFATCLGFDDIYKDIQRFIKEDMQHCNMQLWYPGETSEEMFYINKEMHGSTLNGVFVDKNKEESLKQIFDECEEMPFLQDMSAVKYGFYPIIFIGCRHYRLPIPIHFFKQ